MTTYGYARVSTRKQELGGNGLEVQEAQLREAGCEVIVSEAYTGTTTDRPKLDALLDRLEAGDTFVATKLDRIARSTIQGCQLVRDLMDRDVTVRVLNMGTLENTPVGRMMVSVMFAMAEFERDMIVQRTQEGLEVARRRPGFREGRPPITDTIDMGRFADLSEMVADGLMTNKQAYEELGVSKTTWFKLRRAA